MRGVRGNMGRGGGAGRERAENLCGMNYKKLIENGQGGEVTVLDTLNAPPGAPSGRKSTGVERQDYNIRMRAQVAGGDTLENQHAMLKQWHKVLYSIDNTLVICSVEDDDDQLSSPSLFPLTYEDCSKWFNDLRFFGEKLCWRITATSTGNYSMLRNAMFSWNKANRGYV